jgi:hypothetical protein
MSQDSNPYFPPSADGAPPTRGPAPRLFGWISISLGLAVMSAMALGKLDLSLLLGIGGSEPESGLPAPQAGLMGLVVEGIFAGDERLQVLEQVWFISSRLMPLLLSALGFAQVVRRQWLFWPTVLWTAAALALLAVAAVLAVVILVGPQGLGAALTTGLLLILCAAPYPVALLAAARRARRAGAERAG